MRNNYVLIDHENVQPSSLAALLPEHFKVFVFIGANQNKISSECAIAIQAKGASAQYVRITGSGPNALDFHVAFYIGQLAAKDPDGVFHVISKDTGFDPLLVHLRQRRITASRAPSIAEMSCFGPSSSTEEQRMEAVLANLRKYGDNKPGTVAALENALRTSFGKRFGADGVALLIPALVRRGPIIVTEGKVIYRIGHAVVA